MIHTMLYTEDGHHLRGDFARGDVRRVLADDQCLLWLDLERPTAEDLRLLTGEFNFHPLAVEDVTRRHQRPKIDRYEDFYYIVCYDIDYDETTGAIDEHEIGIFLGKNYLVTVHDEPIAEIGEVAERFQRNQEAIERGVGVLLYSLLDTIVDHYFPVLDRIGERIEDMETRIFAQVGAAEAHGMREIFALKREMIVMRRVLAPERDAVAVLARRELPIVSEASAVYFQDLYEHVLRVTDALDVYRDLLSGVLDSYLSVNSNNLAVAANNLNQVMKVLTSYSIILASVTFIASVYGMNFENMPELHWRYAYFGALCGMAILGIALWLYFKRKTWL